VDLERVQTGEVQGPRRLVLVRVEPEGVQEDVLRVAAGVIRVVVRGYRRVEGNAHGTLSEINTIRHELHLVGVGHQRVLGHGVRGGNELHGVVEVQLLDLVIAGGDLLNLSDEHLLRLGGNHLALILVHHNIARVRGALVGVVEPRRPPDPQLHIVVLEGNQGDAGKPILAEEETERVEVRVGPETAVEAGGERLGSRVGEGIDGDLLTELGGLGVNHLPADEQFHLIHYLSPVGHLLCITVEADRQVGVVQEITETLEADGGHPTSAGVSLEDVRLVEDRKVGVALVDRLEEGYLGVTCDKGVLSTH